MSHSWCYFLPFSNKTACNYIDTLMNIKKKSINTHATRIVVYIYSTFCYVKTKEKKISGYETACSQSFL